MMAGIRRIWKTLYIARGRDFRSLQSVWQTMKGSYSKRYVMDFQSGIGVIETNLPYRELRELLRFADADFDIRDVVTDTKASWDEAE